MTKPRDPAQPGDKFHVIRTGLTIRLGPRLTDDAVILRRAQTVTVTADMIEANRDRNGASFLDLLDDPDEQRRRWGHVKIARGEAPAHLTTWLPGTPEAAEAYQIEKMRILDTIRHPDDVQAALAQLRASELGRAQAKTNKSTPLGRWYGVNDDE